MLNICGCSSLRLLMKYWTHCVKCVASVWSQRAKIRVISATGASTKTVTQKRFWYYRSVESSLDYISQRLKHTGTWQSRYKDMALKRQNSYLKKVVARGWFELTATCNFCRSGNRSAGYEPAGITWLPHLADSILTQGEYISVCTAQSGEAASSDKHNQIFSSVLSRETHTYRLPFEIGLIAVEYMLPIFYATIPDFEDCWRHIYTTSRRQDFVPLIAPVHTHKVEGMYNPQ